MASVDTSNIIACEDIPRTVERFRIFFGRKIKFYGGISYQTPCDVGSLSKRAQVYATSSSFTATAQLVREFSLEARVIFEDHAIV